MCECMNEEGARCVMVPFYNGTSRQEARKRGGKKNAKEEMDLNKMKTLFLQLPTVQQNETDEMKYVIPPTLGRGGGVTRRYIKFVNKAVDKADMMLKLLGTPVAYLASSMHNM